ncbi:MAG: hypothetical protein L6W00_25020 [Lentisphaeria bacterium]|nr:MAG: hypothetical protein L6W00_25020 [Lentisphaeria bacterium]
MSDLRNIFRRFPADVVVGGGVFLLAVLPFLPSTGYPFLIEWDDGRFCTVQRPADSVVGERVSSRHPHLSDALHAPCRCFR